MAEIPQRNPRPAHTPPPEPVATPSRGSRESGGRGLAGYGVVIAACCTVAAALALPSPSPSTAPTASSTSRVPAGALATGGGNGIERLSARQIADKAERAVLGADSLHVRLTDKEARGRHRPSALEMRLDARGNCEGGFTLAGGGTAALVKRGDQVWLRPDREFWQKQVPRRGGGIARFVGDRYVHGTVRDAFLRRTARFCDLDALRGRIEEAAAGTGTLTKGRPVRVDGVRTVPLNGGRDGGSGTVHVSAVGTPYPLRAAVRGRNTDVTASLSDFGEPVPAATPSASRSVDVSKLADRLPD